MKLRILTIPLLLAPLACASERDGESGPSTTTRDSAGIRIIENAKPPEESRVWQVAPGPALSIGDRDGDNAYMLYQVSDATRLPDGRIVVASSGDNEMRVFDASGTHLATWGGAGEGPGEFQYLELVEPWPGDSIIAWYGPRNGVLVFDSEGNLGRAFTLEPTVEHPIASVRAMAVIPGGAILAGHHPHVLDPVVVEIRDAEGRLRSSLGEHPGDERHITPDGRRADPIYSALAVQVPWGDLIVHNLNNRYEIRAFAEDGSLARIVRRHPVARPPTQAEIDAYIEERASWHPVDLTPAQIEEHQAEMRQSLQSLPVAEHITAFSSVIVDRLDHLWVEEFELPGQARTGSLWTVFDPGGRVLGFVETPDRLEIFEIGEDYILGRSWDEMYVEYVQLWALER